MDLGILRKTRVCYFSWVADMYEYDVRLFADAFCKN